MRQELQIEIAEQCTAKVGEISDPAWSRREYADQSYEYPAPNHVLGFNGKGKRKQHQFPVAIKDRKSHQDSKHAAGGAYGWHSGIGTQEPAVSNGHCYQRCRD